MNSTSLVHSMGRSFGFTRVLSPSRRNVISVLSIFALFAISWQPTMAKEVKPYEKFDLVGGPPMHNFDLLDGIWSVESHSLKQRMAAEKEWLHNEMESTYRIRLSGLVAINETYGTFNGKPMHGFMIRTYDPDKDEWLFQWMSQGYPHLTEQVRGRFEGGIGVFYGSEVHAGRTYRMRFRWKLITKDHAFWEQSYLNPETAAWEVNWTLDLKRKSKSPEE